MTPLQSIRIKSHIADIDSANDRQHRGLRRDRPKVRQVNTTEYLSEPQVHDAIQRTDHHSYLVLVVKDIRVAPMKRIYPAMGSRRGFYAETTPPPNTVCEPLERGLAHRLGLWIPDPAFLTPYLKTWSESEINAYDAVR